MTYLIPPPFTTCPECQTPVSTRSMKKRLTDGKLVCARCFKREAK